MRRILLTMAAILIAASLPVFAGDTPEPATIRGEVVATRLSPATAGEPPYAEVQVRTRTQERVWLRLGPAEEVGSRFQEGDPVRARVLGAGKGEPSLVREMRNERTGDRVRLRDASGQMLRAQDRDRLRDGTGDRSRDRSRDRIHEPGTGGGRGGGGRRGGR
jgi:hypothetical protein